MLVVTLLNEKGGVGKTTIALHLAAGLAIKGYRVVFLDTDSQANATAALGLPKSGAFYDLMVRGASWKDTLCLVHPDVYGLRKTPPAGTLYAVPGNVETRNVETTVGSAGVFRSRVQELRSGADYVIVDTSPTPSLFHASILVATDGVLIPTQCEVFSAWEGLVSTLLSSESARQSARDYGIDAARVWGIIPTMFRPKVGTHEGVCDELRNKYGALVWPPLHQRIDYAEARLANQFVFNLRPRATAALDLWALVNRVESMAKAGVYEQA